MAFWVGVDVGGTFTDLTLFSTQSCMLKHYKLSSTPDDPSIAIVDGVRQILQYNNVEPDEVEYLAHGTTVATNALIQRKGAKTALLTTKGYKDLLEIGRQTRPSLYDFSRVKPEPLVHGKLIREIDERILYNGEEYKCLDEESAVKNILDLKEQGVESVAVCMIFSYINPVHEKKISDLLSKYFPEAFVSLSHRVSPEFREVPRMSTTVVNAFLGPIMETYIENFQDSISKIGIKCSPYITQSNGSIISIGETKSTPVRTALSGPSSGVVAAKHMANLCGEKQIITFDMGGTSADICLLNDGSPEYASEKELEGYTLRIPMIDIKTIGAGGGSIAHIDEGGALKVGPESAGAVPGPAAYMRGGDKPTVTDANIVLGRLNPEKLLNGRMNIDSSLAEQAIKDHICAKTGIDMLEAARGIIDIVNANMMRTVRVVSVERGYDIRDFALVSFGGAGPLHSCELAEDLGINKIIVPASPGTFCSLGLLVADIQYDYVRTCILPAENNSLEKINAVYEELIEEGKQFLDHEKIESQNRIYQRQADARYHMQNYELTIRIPSGKLDEQKLKEFCDYFHKEHERKYGYCDRSQKIELVNLRVSTIGLREKPTLLADDHKREHSFLPFQTRKVWFRKTGFISCPIYYKSDIPTELDFSGPAIIEQMDTTVVITPEWRCRIDKWGNIRMKRSHFAGEGSDEG